MSTWYVWIGKLGPPFSAHHEIHHFSTIIYSDAMLTLAFLLFELKLERQICSARHQAKLWAYDSKAVQVRVER